MTTDCPAIFGSINAEMGPKHRKDEDILGIRLPNKISSPGTSKWSSLRKTIAGGSIAFLATQTISPERKSGFTCQRGFTPLPRPTMLWLWQLRGVVGEVSTEILSRLSDWIGLIGLFGGVEAANSSQKLTFLDVPRPGVGPGDGREATDNHLLQVGTAISCQGNILLVELS